VDVIVLIAFSSIIWLCWQLYRAKQFNHFKKRIETEIKPQLVSHITQQLTDQRCDLFPNNDCHIEATLVYWTYSKARMLQKALIEEIIDEKWLKDTGNLRHCQHLFHIEQKFLNKN
jgi:hypothetical protein